MILTVNDKTYRVEFHHKTKLGRRAGLRKAPIKAITTSVLISDRLVAIENAICADGDGFSRQEGRFRAFEKLLQYCGALRDVATDLWTEYLKADPPRPPRPKKEAFSPEVRERLKQEGQAHKFERRLERKLTRRRTKLDKFQQAGKVA